MSEPQAQSEWDVVKSNVDSTAKKDQPVAVAPAGEWGPVDDLPKKSGKEQSDWMMKQATDAATHTAEGLWGAVSTPVQAAYQGAKALISPPSSGESEKFMEQFITGPMKSTREKGAEMAKSPNRATAIMGGVTYALGYAPVVGPLAGQVTSNLGEGNFGAAIGDALGLYLSGKAPEKIGKGLEAAGESAYGASLRLTKQGRMKAGDVIKRGVREGIEMDAAGLEKVNSSLKREGMERDLITKDPTNPQGFALNTIPLDEVRTSILSHFDPIKKYFPSEYAKVVKQVEEWIKSLDQTPTPKTRTPKTFGVSAAAKGATAPTPTVPRARAKFTTVEKVQELKEAISQMLRNASFDPMRKAPEMGMEQWTRIQAETATHDLVQKAVKGMTDGVNKSLHEHILLRGAIVDAMQRNPSWINDWAIFAAGAGLERLVAGMAKEGVSPGLGAAVTAGALTRAAVRNPRVMSRLGIALNASGINIAALAPVFRAASAAHTATKGGKKDDSGNPIPTGLDVEFTTGN